MKALPTWGPKVWARLLSGMAVLALIVTVIWILADSRAIKNLPTYSGVLVATSVTPNIPTPSTSVVIATPTATYSEPGLVATTEAIMQIIPSATPNADLPPDKQADEQHNDLRRRAASTAVALYPPPRDIYDGPSSPVPPPRTPFPMPVTTRQATGGGIIWEDTFLGPPCKMVNTSNYWKRTTDAGRIEVCAGRVKEGIEPQGQIAVEVWPAGQERPNPPDYYMTPIEAGAVWIEDVVGDTVLFHSEAGTVFNFDLVTRQWNSPTPGPSPSPMQSPLASPLPSPSP